MGIGYLTVREHRSSLKNYLATPPTSIRDHLRIIGCVFPVEKFSTTSPNSPGWFYPSDSAQIAGKSPIVLLRPHVYPASYYLRTPSTPSAKLADLNCGPTRPHANPKLRKLRFRERASTGGTVVPGGTWGRRLHPRPGYYALVAVLVYALLFSALASSKAAAGKRVLSRYSD